MKLTSKTLAIAENLAEDNLHMEDVLSFVQNAPDTQAGQDSTCDLVNAIDAHGRHIADRIEWPED